jgi:ABC-2 type transport system ATP-binding protein
MRNSAGKTTMVRILSTLIPAYGGDIRVGGYDLVTDPEPPARDHLP